MSRSAEGVIEKQRLATETAMRYLLDPECPVVARSSWKPYSVTDPWPWARQSRTSLKNSNVGTASSVSGVRNMAPANV
jgi:hypothetical protein